jgi:plastocyanin
VKILMRISQLILLFFAGFAMVVPTAKVSRAASAAAPSEVEVKIDNFSFGPQSITVAPGTKVTWKNRDDIPHMVVSTESVFKSRVLDTDETFSFTFDKPGTYPYFCSVHPKMTGQVVVK